MALVETLIKEGFLKSPRIISAFRKINRKDFLSSESRSLAELNSALPIGYNQTISQPLVVAFMLELLELREREKILDIGSGSGWTSALLAHIVSGGMLKKKAGGRVIAIEVIPELKEFGEKNVAKYNFTEKGIVKFICADGSQGYKKESPYDKILVSASAQETIPQPLKEQLKIGGRMVAPINNSIWFFDKKSENQFEKKEYPGFVFVPLVKK